MKKIKRVLYDPETLSFKRDIKAILYNYHLFFKIPPMNWGVFRQFIAITIFKWILFRGKILTRVLQHEMIHVEQQARECCAVMFYIKYWLEFLYNYLFKYPFKFTKAYYNISYEVEAYERTH